jgi:hypothetical protein
MKIPRFFLTLVLSLLGTVAAFAADTSARVYELRTYTATPGNEPAVLARFREHTMRIFEKHGMVNVGYWVPADAKDGAGEKLVYLLQHASRDAAKASWKSFNADPEWQAVRKKSEANGKIVAKAESVFLAPTDYSKAMDAGKRAGAARVFEMRTYTAADGKLANLDARFRDHTLALFARHGITNLGYFHPTDADKGAANTLVYFLAHPSREAATAAWQKFRDDPDWVKARTASEKHGKLTTKVESVFLIPTDFSPLK